MSSGSVESAFLNPAFGASAIHAYVTSYEKQGKAVPVETIFPCMAIAFNGDLRDELSGNQTSNLVSVLGANPQLKVGLAEATQTLQRFTWRSLAVLVAAGRVELAPDGLLKSKVSPAQVSDSDRCISSMRLLGTLAGKVGDPTTLFALLEVRP